jgi:hypothetical protein
MNCFLIDFENVKSSGLKGIERLTDTDDVYIFYSDYANSITFDVHHKMNQSKAKIELFKSNILGKNSLDFQLISYLGYLIAQMKYQNYCVVTNDRGFEAAIKFWKDFFKENKVTNITVNRYRTVQDALNKKVSKYSRSVDRSTTSTGTISTTTTYNSYASDTDTTSDDYVKVSVSPDGADTRDDRRKSKPEVRAKVETRLDTETETTNTNPNNTTNSNSDRKPSVESNSSTNSNNSTTTNSSNSSFRGRSKTYSQGSQRIVTNSNNFKDELPKASGNKSDSDSNSQDTKPKSQMGSYSYRPSKYLAEQQSNSNGASNTTTNKKPYSNSYSSNNSNNNNNNRKRPPQQNQNRKSYGYNSNNSNSTNSSVNNTNSTNTTNDSNGNSRSTATNSTTNANATKSKSFVFGKVNLNDEVQTVENIQSKNVNDTNTNVQPKGSSKPKTSYAPKLEDLKESIAVKTPATKDVVKESKDVKDTKPSNDNKPKTNTTTNNNINNTNTNTNTVAKQKSTPETKANTTNNTNAKPVKDTTTTNNTTPTASKPVEKTTKKKSNGENAKPKVTETTKKSETAEKPKTTRKSTAKKDETPSVKRKVGRPRIRPIEDESKKPKNNKKFQNNIPSDKLTLMMDKVSQIGDLNSLSSDDKVKLCKIVAFSDSKQECYKAFMSCFGKSEGIRIYGLIKSQTDAIKNVYLN